MDDGRPELTAAAVSSPGGRIRTSGISPRPFLLLAGVALAAGVPFVFPSASRPPFDHTFESPRALAEEVLDGLQARDRDRLARLALSEREFKEEVWPEMPAEGRVPADYVWNDLQGKSSRSLAQSLIRYGGRSYTLVDMRFQKDAKVYETLVVHRRLQLLVRDEQGREGSLDALGSVIEKNGRYKLFSYVVD